MIREAILLHDVFVGELNLRLYQGVASGHARRADPLFWSRIRRRIGFCSHGNCTGSPPDSYFEMVWPFHFAAARPDAPFLSLLSGAVRVRAARARATCKNVKKL
eukprot:4819563-Prymnesium_polylepis.1